MKEVTFLEKSEKLGFPPLPAFFDNPFGLLRRFTTDMERLFDEFAVARPFTTTEPRLTSEVRWVPTVDVFEKEGKLIVRADLPGLTKKDIKVEVNDNVLILKGERKTELKEEHEGVYRRERVHGAFSRTFPLPENVKPEDIKAVFTNGVLELTMPAPVVAKPPKPRQIEISEPEPEKALAAV